MKLMQAAPASRGLSRRSVIRCTAAGAAAIVLGKVEAGAAAGPLLSSAHRPVTLGLTDATVRKELREDYAGTLRRIAAMGYTHFGFRLAPYSDREPPEPSAEDKARMVRDCGMAVGVVRYGFACGVEEQVDAAAAIGASVMAYTAAPIFFSSTPMGVATRAQFDAWLPELGRLAEAARAGGLTLAYHNHWWDHAPIGGEAPLRLIARTYPPGLVAFEIDLAWAYVGGADVLHLVKSLKERVVSLHLKDAIGDASLGPMQRLRLLGGGDMDFARLLPEIDRTCHATGYVELDTTVDGMGDALRAAETIRMIRGGRKIR
ncbi:xylose isomerase domain-containing protein [Sphingomonas sp. LH128]|nr:xylose isomerase domain-containing protein [Sphingomonas sp. LH128]